MAQFIAVAAAVVLSCAVLPARAEPTTQPIALRPGPHLFVDDYLIAAQKSLTRRTEHPTRLPQPIVTGKEDKNFQPYVTVLRDSGVRRRYRMWFGVPARPPAGNPSHLAYMESRDGMHWNRPPRVLDDPGGLEIRFGTSVIDDGPDVPDPNKRLKLGFYWGSVTEPPTGGLMIATSADGVAWTPLDVTPPVIKHVGDINNIWRDPIRKRYVATFSDVRYDPQQTPLKARGAFFQSFSDDLVHWSQPVEAIATDEKDDPNITRSYGLSGFVARGDLVIGLVKILLDDLPADPNGKAEGIGYTTLAWTRDGVHWQRDRDIFLDRNLTPGSWDHAMSWGDCQLMMGEEVYLYYGGYKQGHKVERFTERQIGLATLPRDRYIARVADEEKAGTIVTPAVQLSGGVARMTVNARVNDKGELRIRALDENGSPVAGFDFGDCIPIRGDNVAHAVRWTGGEADHLIGRPIRFEFSLRDTAVYSFDLSE